MARTARSAATERAYLHFAQAPRGAVVVPTSPAAANAAGADEDFDESDIWDAFAPAEPARASQLLAAPAAADKPAPALAPGGRVAHGSLPMKIPDWSKILGPAYQPAGYHHGIGGAGDWEVDDEEEYSVETLPPHELVGRRRAASLSLSLKYVVGRTLKIRDAVWMSTTGFQD